MKKVKCNYKMVERRPAPKGKYGTKKKTRHDLESHEERTINRLVSFGFDVETVIPSNIPKSKNPDILMMGTTWEMKSPQTINQDTIRAKFRKAVRQANGKSIIDLCRIKGSTKVIEEYILELFLTTRGIHHMMIIKKDGKNRIKILDFLK